MAEIKVYNTENQEIATIAENTINSTFETSLIGENVENFIGDINDNFVKLLENFAGESTPPQASTNDGAVEGQIWYDKANNRINYRTNSEWLSNADKIGGKTLDGVREYVLSGLDTTGKLSKTGGTITGEVDISGAVQIQKSILPVVTEQSNLGGKNNRFRNIYLKEDGITLGDKSKGLKFKSNNFVYVVENDNSDVSKFPVGAIILHQETGEAIIKKSTGIFGANNKTFRKLADDKQNSAVIGGNKFRFLGDIGLIAGGWGSVGGHRNASIEKITISTPGNGQSFGNLTYGRSHMGAGMSSGIRGVFQGGWNGSHGSHNGKMDYVTFASPSNATYFGTIGYENYGSSSVSDGTKGIIGPGYNARTPGPRGHHYIATYITIETPGNSSKFGTIKQGYWGSAVSSGTRGVFGGYSRRGWSSRLEYITIQTLKNSIYFGSTRRHRGPAGSALTDTIKGLYFGGWDGNWTNNYIEYITIATPSNGIDFGRTRRSRNSAGIGLSNGITGVSAATWWDNTMESVTIQTPMNSINFGNMTMRRGSRPSGASGN